ncbi:MAG TPA: hypothetical protein VFX70_13230 [Mycobacteriales bacterium]|nr:hypothetical protein [Mycobacteriales bacterium]
MLRRAIVLSVFVAAAWLLTALGGAVANAYAGTPQPAPRAIAVDVPDFPSGTSDPLPLALPGPTPVPVGVGPVPSLLGAPLPAVAGPAGGTPDLVDTLDRTAGSVVGVDPLGGAAAVLGQVLPGPPGPTDPSAAHRRFRPGHRGSGTAPARHVRPGTGPRRDPGRAQVQTNSRPDRSGPTPRRGERPPFAPSPGNGRPAPPEGESGPGHSGGVGGLPATAPPSPARPAPAWCAPIRGVATGRLAGDPPVWPD